MTTTTLILKHWFVPHHGNRHQPRVLSLPSLLAIALLLIFVQLSYNFTVSGQWKVLGFATNISQSAVVNLTNNQRQVAGLPALRTSSTLNNAARLKAEHMFKYDYWAHVSPDGTQPWTFIKSAGYVYSHAGENLARDFNTSEGVVAGWMASAGHKANILNNSYTEVGVAVVNGVLLGEETTLVVAFYAQPMVTQVALNQASPTNTARQPKSSQPAQPIPAAFSSATEAGELRVVGENNEPKELAPSARSISTVQPLLFTSTLGWGPLLTLGVAGSLMPVYIATHVNMVRRKLYQASKWLWRRRLMELGLVLTLLTTLVLRSWGSVS